MRHGTVVKIDQQHAFRRHPTGVSIQRTYERTIEPVSSPSAKTIVKFITSGASSGSTVPDQFSYLRNFISLTVRLVTLDLPRGTACER
jgi:hypothetical protein